MAKKESETYETMLSRVESILSDISNADIGLDDVVTRVEEAYDLIGKMRQRLDESKSKVENLRAQFESQ